MKRRLKLCLLTPEQEAAIEKTTDKYSGDDRLALGILVNSVQNLVNILEAYSMDRQDDATEDQYLTMFQILDRLIEPVQEYFANTCGCSFVDDEETDESA